MFHKADTLDTTAYLQDTHAKDCKVLDSIRVERMKAFGFRGCDNRPLASVTLEGKDGRMISLHLNADAVAVLVKALADA